MRQRGLQQLLEVGGVAKEGEAGVLRVGVADVAEEAAADDAAFAPQERGRAVVDVPAVLFGGFADEHEALCVGDDFRGKQRLAQGFCPRSPVAVYAGDGFAEGLCGGFALVFQGGDAAGEDGFGDEGERDVRPSLRIWISC